MNRVIFNRPGIALALAAAVGLTAQSASAGNLAATKKVPLPRPRPAIHSTAKETAAPGFVPPVAATLVPPKTPNKTANTTLNLPIIHNVKLPANRPHSADPGLSAYAQANVGLRGALFASRATFQPMTRPVSGPFAIAPTPATSAADIALVKQVIDATRKGNEVVSDVAENSIADPIARKLAEWLILKSDNTKPSFQRYANFIAANPSWPHSPLFRRRAENALWNDRLDDGTVRAFFANRAPITSKGRYVLARALLALGDSNAAAELVRHAWRKDEASADVERKVLEMFGSLLTPADHKARMEQRFYAEDVEAGLRAAERLGGNDLLIARARAAVIKKAGNAKAALDAVPAAARGDAGYIFAQVQWLRKTNKAEEAGKLILTAPKDPAVLVNLDQW